MIEGICLYRRFRLIRNLEEHRFTAAMTTDDSTRVKSQIEESIYTLPGFRNADMKTLLLEDRYEQQRRISEGILLNDPMRSNLVVGLMESKDRQTAVVINDTDHLRLDCRSFSMTFDELWQRVDQLDDQMASAMTFAYREPYGYLTSRIEQLGTGLCGEALLHLPALKKTGFISSLAESAGSIGIQIKPVKSDFFHVSNTVTLGRGEVELSLLLDQVVIKLAERELAGRETLMNSEGNKWIDSIGRAFGISRYCAIAEEDEAMEWMSKIMLGEQLGLIAYEQDDIDREEEWYKCLIHNSDVMIEVMHHRSIGYRDRLQFRAENLRRIVDKRKWRG